jgi:hypothetical protein
MAGSKNEIEKRKLKLQTMFMLTVVWALVVLASVSENPMFDSVIKFAAIVFGAILLMEEVYSIGR